MGTSNLAQREAYRVMLKDYPDVMNAEQVCEVLGIGMKTCYRILKEGKLMSIRVGRAYRIPNCGFNNHSYFTRAIVKKYGMTPVKYRKSCQHR